LLEVKLGRERNKIRLLQPIVSRLEDLDNIAMDGPFTTTTQYAKQKNGNQQFHGLIHAAIDLVIKEDRKFSRWKESGLT
jgi:hypothetical protein